MLGPLVEESTLKNRFSTEVKEHGGWPVDSDSQEPTENFVQKAFALCQGLHDFVEVHACSAEDDVDLVTEYAFEPVPVEPLVVFQVTEGWFDRSPVLHPPPGVPGDVASAASVDVDEAGAGVIMLPVTHVNEHFVRSGFGESFELFDGAGQCVSIVWIAMLRLRGDYPAAFAGRSN